MATRRPAKGGVKSLRNHSNARVSVFDSEGVAGDKGIRYDIEAQQVKDLPAALADLFLEQRAKFVTIYEPMDLPVKPGDAQVWVANATGNPMLPAKVTVMRIEKGKKVPFEIPNPLREPRVVSRVMQGSWKVVKSDEGSGDESRPGTQLRFEFPPFRRFLMSETYAAWNLRRDELQEVHLRGQIIECAPPRDYEPNDSWSLTRLQSYAECLGYEPVTRTEVFGRPEASYATRDETEKAKATLLRALFFALLSDIATPSEMDANAFYESFKIRRRDQITAKPAAEKETGASP